MPGSGKSTFGRRLATDKDLEFVDTDTLVERRFGCSLQTILDRRGIGVIRAIEEDTICQINVNDSVIATGGSAVYSKQAMQHLKSLGRIVYLKISLPTLLRRVNNVAVRGLVKYPATSMQSLYFERKPLYEQWQQITLNNNKPLSAMHYANLVSELD